MIKIYLTIMTVLVRSGIRTKCCFSALILCFEFIVDLHPDLLVDLQVYGRGNVYVDIFLVCYFETNT